MRGPIALALLALLPALAAAAGNAAPRVAQPLEPAVARARYSVGGSVHNGGTVFFLAAPRGGGVVAVGAAHAFDFAALGRAARIEFRLGRSERMVGVARRVLAPPGRALSAPGGTIRGDLVLFALDGPPSGARVLLPDPRPLVKPGERVRILGIPNPEPREERGFSGTVRAASRRQIEIALDTVQDLRGWGGAPVLSVADGRVVGVLEAAWQSGGRLRLAAAPIAAVTAAMARALGGGRGEPLAALASHRASSRSASSEPAGISRSAHASPRQPGVRRRAWIRIEHPDDGAIVGDPAGAFVAGRALAPVGEYHRIDVAVVIDTSESTADPSGVDVNGNGVVGEARPDGEEGVFGVGNTDPGDSILAAEVASARRLIRSLDPRSTRVCLVTFAGEPPRTEGFFPRARPAAAWTEVALTHDFDAVERALDRVLQQGSEGSTNMAAGVDRATDELLGRGDALSKADPRSEKVVLLFTDGRQTLPYGPAFPADNARVVLHAADRAARAHVRVHTFGLGDEALRDPVSLVDLATRTGGIFTPVRNPGDLIDVVDRVDFANIDRILVRNETTGRASSVLVKNPDGSFGALVPLEPGRNRVEVLARATDGRQAHAEITLQYAPNAPPVPVPDSLLAEYNRLLEQRLIQLQRNRAAIEERARRRLELEIDRQRGRGESQRKELRLEVESPPLPAPPPSGRPERGGSDASHAKPSGD